MGGTLMEKWDVYDKNGNLTGYTKTKNDVWTSDEYHLGASLWIINYDGNLLIQKRAASKRRLPNVWCNIGGSVVSGENSRQGCVREVEEEIGIKVNSNDLILLQSVVFSNTINDDYALIYDFPIENVVLQAEEVSDVKWASVDEIKKLFTQGLFMINELEDIEKLNEYISKNIQVRA
jgi:isopentenyldiphosphate isomerase